MTTTPSLDVDISHRLGAFTLQARFSAPPGLTALFGRSGSGKTTLVNAIAGLNRPDHGRILVRGVPLLDTERPLFVAPHRRRIGYVFQEARLFPHLSVRQNLRYGSWFADRSRAYADFDAIVAMLGIGHLLDRRPNVLSGGEKQRVAIGRALMASPQILLMDEPMASLDEARKNEIAPFIERVRDQALVPIVYVSHSVAEVSRLATTIVVLADGKVAASGDASSVLSQAGIFHGTDRDETGVLVPTRVIGHDETYDLTILGCGAGQFFVPRVNLPMGSAVRLRIRARDVTLATRRPHHSSAQNVLEGIIIGIGQAAGPIVDLQLDCHGDHLVARLTRRAVAMLELRPGLPVFAIVKSVTLEGHSSGLQGQSDNLERRSLW